MRKKAEEALQESENKFRSFAEHSLVGIYLLQDGVFKYVNPKFAEIFGYTLDECLDNLIFQKLVYADDVTLVEEQIKKRIENQVKSTHYVFRGVRKNKEIVNLEIFGSSTMVEGRPAAIGTMLDVTERNQAEEQIKASLKEKETLIDEIHHRVKNNMAIIASLLKMQSNSIENEQVKEVLKDSQNRVYAMSAVHETLHRSKNLSEIDLKTYLSKVTLSIFKTYSVTPDKVKLNTDIDKIPIGIDQTSPLGLVINELISNSLKYAFPDERKGEISVSMKKLGKELELIVMDDGIGIPEGLDWKNSKSLGLKLVQTLVENQLDGSIDIESNNGTKFIIKFNIEA